MIRFIIFMGKTVIESNIEIYIFLIIPPRPPKLGGQQNGHD